MSAPALAATLAAVAVAAVSVAAAGCGEKASCLDGTGACTVATPCSFLRGTCVAGQVGYAELFVLGPDDRGPGGLDALAAEGDLVLGNEWLVAAIDAIDVRNFLAPSGGALLDLTVRGANADSMNHGYHLAGILPADAFHYDVMEILEEGPDVAAVQFRGTLDGRDDVFVATRYEVRACEPWVRIRTELVNLGQDPNTFVVADAYFWGNREPVPFTPVEGEGFVHEPISLLQLGEQWSPFPFVATLSEAPPYLSYSEVACDREALSGVNSTTVSAAGTDPVILNPGEHIVFERVVVALAGDDVAASADMARVLREALFEERAVVARGVVSDGMLPVGGSIARASVIVYGRGSDGAASLPLTQVVPDEDGLFEVLLPEAAGPFVAEVHSFGRVVTTSAAVGPAADLVEFGALVVPAPAHLFVSVTEGGAPSTSLVVLDAANDETRAAVAGKLHGLFLECAPWLGAPFGPSPACNKVIAADGEADFDLPAGVYRVYASRGPFSTLAMEEVAIGAGEAASVTLAVAPLDLVPPGTLSGDFHVHGAASFDSSFPDRDRVLSFVAAGVEVIAATDHDVVSNYSDAIDELGVGDAVKVLTGVETTSQIPWLMVEGDSFPHVIGHYNFWPIEILPNAARNGTPDDELVEPGGLFARMDGLFTGLPMREMNHPWDAPEFGRDLGFFRAVGVSLLEPIPAFDDGTPNGYLAPDRRPGPPGSCGEADGCGNLDFNAQEVINGTNLPTYEQYRAIWFWLLNQGYLRTGVANSDSHTLNDSSLGYGRNLVDASFDLASFDGEAFDAAVAGGRVVGTNGPVIVATIEGDDGEPHGPSLTPFRPGASAAVTIRVLAAPWIPVEEVRVVVNGVVVRTIGSDELDHPADAFGAGGLLRYDGVVPLAELFADAGLEGARDAWIVVEAGYPFVVSFDENGDGVPDTGDNDGDGIADASDALGTDEGGPCASPPDCFLRPPDPTDATDPLFHATRVVPGLWPSAFTNPLLVDRAGDGWEAPGL